MEKEKIIYFLIKEIIKSESKTELLKSLQDGLCLVKINCKDF